MPDVGRVAVADSFRRITLQPNNVTISADDVDDALTLTAGNFIQFVANEVGDEITINAASTISASFDGGDVVLLTNFLSTQAATNTTTGAVRITGGLGVGGSVYANSIQNTPIGSSTKATGGFTSLTAVGTTTLEGAVTINGLDVTTAITPLGTGTVTINPNTVGTINKMSIGATTRSTGAFTTLASDNTTTLAGAVDINGNNVNVVISPIGTGTVTIQPVGGLTLNPTTLGTINNSSIGATTRSTGAFTTLTANAATTLTANTASTTTGSGTLVVTGGVGISGQATINNLVVNVNTASSSTATGTIVVTGGVGVSGDIYAGGIQSTPIGASAKSTAAFTTLTANNAVTFTHNTESTTTGSGTLVVTGGIGLSGNIYAGGNAVVTGSGSFAGITSTGSVSLSPASANVTISPTGTGTVAISPAGSLTINPATAGTINNVSVGASTRSTGAFTTLGANNAVLFDTTTNNQSYTTTGSGTITVASGTVGSINNMSIGAVTEASGRFTTMTSTVASGTAPLTVASNTVVANFQSATASRWHTTRTLTLTGYVTGSANIDGSSNISIATVAETNAVTLGVGTIGQYASTVAVSGSGLSITAPNADDGTAYTIASNATSANTANTLIFRDASGNFSAGTVSAAVNASTVTASSTVTLNPTNANISIQPTGTGTVIINPTVTGSIDNATVGVTGAASGRFTTLSATGNVTLNGAGAAVEIRPSGLGTVTIRPNTVGAVDNVNIGATVPWIGSFTELNTNSTVNMIGAGAAISLTPTGAGTVTINPATVGSINNMSVGASTRSTGAFTSLAANAAVTLDAAVAASSKTTGTVIVTGGVGISGSVYSTAMIATDSITTPLLTMQGNIVLPSGKLINARVVQTLADIDTDINITSLMSPASIIYYNFLKVSAVGMYVNDPSAPTVTSRIHKSWVQGVWYNGAAWQLDGAALEQGAFNTDSINFAAGTVNAGKALVVVNSTQVLLRFSNRNSPSLNSTTTWTYTMEIMNT